MAMATQIMRGQMMVGNLKLEVKVVVLMINKTQSMELVVEKILYLHHKLLRKIVVILN